MLISSCRSGKSFGATGKMLYSYIKRNTAPLNKKRVTMAENAAVEATTRKSVQVAVTVPAEYFDGLVDNKWRNREEVRDFARRALDSLVAAEGILIDGSAPQHDAKKK